MLYFPIEYALNRQVAALTTGDYIYEPKIPCLLHYIIKHFSLNSILIFKCCGCKGNINGELLEKAPDFVNWTFDTFAVLLIDGINIIVNVKSVGHFVEHVGGGN